MRKAFLFSDGGRGLRGVRRDLKGGAMFFYALRPKNLKDYAISPKILYYYYVAVL